MTPVGIGSANLISSLAALGDDLVAPEDAAERYNLDWTGEHRGKALAIVRPRNVDEVAAVVRWCNANRIALVPQGGNTGLVAGATPSPDGCEVVLSLERMKAIRDINILDGVAIVEAGCVLSEFKSTLEQAGAFFPLTIGSQGSCQIGGTISTNAGGINVVRYGMMRALVMGLEVVLPDGQIFRDLRGLYKNNTGYDLKQLFIGAEGTLGVVTAAALKLLPRPRHVETMIIATASVASAVALFHRMRQDAGELISAFELMMGDCIEEVCKYIPGLSNPLSTTYPACVIVELSSSGGPSLRDWLEDYLAELLEESLILDCALSQSGAQTSNLWKLREGIVECQTRLGPYLRTDISTPISAIPEFVRAGLEIVFSRIPEARVYAYGHIGDGNLHFNVVRPASMAEAQFEPCIVELEEALFALVDSFKGSISAEHGIGICKRSAFDIRLDSVQRSLMHNLKSVLDPYEIMSPGRVLIRR